MDKEIIAEHSAGLMASTGCPSGELQTRLRLGQFDEALKAAADGGTSSARRTIP
jgi:DNA polymerase III, alpha subunit